MDFKFVSHGLFSEKQNILLQHMHKKEFGILTNKCGNNLKYENESVPSFYTHHAIQNFYATIVIK